MIGPEFLPTVLQIVAGFLLGIMLLSAVTNAFAAAQALPVRAGYLVLAALWCALALYPSLAGISAAAIGAAAIALGGAWRTRTKNGICACFGDISMRIKLLLPIIRRLICSCCVLLLVIGAYLYYRQPVRQMEYSLTSGLLIFIIAISGLLPVLMPLQTPKVAPATDRFPLADIDWHGLPLVRPRAESPATLGATLRLGGQRLVLFGASECVSCHTLAGRLAHVLPKLAPADTVVLAGIQAPDMALASVSDGAALDHVKRLLNIRTFPTAILLTRSADGYVMERIVGDILGRAIDLAKAPLQELPCA